MIMELTYFSASRAGAGSGLVGLVSEVWDQWSIMMLESLRQTLGVKRASHHVRLKRPDKRMRLPEYVESTSS